MGITFALRVLVIVMLGTGDVQQHITMLHTREAIDWDVLGRKDKNVRVARVATQVALVASPAIAIQDMETIAAVEALAIAVRLILAAPPGTTIVPKGGQLVRLAIKCLLFFGDKSKEINFKKRIEDKTYRNRLFFSFLSHHPE
eukprot:m.314603 g.314603  ORF g.314603 m.314603 type:complete len:143 (-) comp16494_c4_seq14:284-712(-)